MSCHDIGRGLSSVVKVILEKLDSGEISANTAMCSCKKCAIDGGKEYVRFSAPKPDDVIFLTEYEDNKD